MPSVHVRVPDVGDATGLCTAYVENREFLAPWEPLRDDEFFTVKGQRTRFERGVGRDPRRDRVQLRNRGRAEREQHAEIAATAGRLVCDRHLAGHPLSMRFHRTEYTFGSQATIERPCAEVRHWLVTPRLMPKWIVGLDAVVSLSAPVDTVGALFLLDFGPGAGTPGTFRGEILEIGETSLVRRYRPSFGADAYERTVRYDIRADPAGSELSCTVHTVRLTPGIEVRQTARRKELQHLERSLGRLRALAEGRAERSLLRRILDAPTTPQPL